MEPILTVRLDNNVFNAIKQQAEVSGISPELLAANLLKQQFEETFKQRIKEAESQAAQERFESHFGEMSLAGEQKLSQSAKSEYPLQGTVLRYEDPFESAVSEEDWEVLK